MRVAALPKAPLAYWMMFLNFFRRSLKKMPLVRAVGALHGCRPQANYRARPRPGWHMSRRSSTRLRQSHLGSRRRPTAAWPWPDREPASRLPEELEIVGDDAAGDL